MGVIREIPPTAGFTLSAGELCASWNRLRWPGSLEEDFSGYLDAKYTRIVCSGTAGLYYIAAAIKEISARRTVVVPAFICPSVVLAIARAGLKVRVCDVRSDSFDYERSELERICAADGDLAAILVMHLGGIPADMESIAEVIGKKDVLIIEDCAQSLGAEYHGKKVGVWGDISFFSLARGKGLTIYEGGVVVTNSVRFTDCLERTIDALEHERWMEETVKVVELAGYAAFYRPRMFWWVYRLPEIFWHLTGQRTRELSEHFTLDFPVQRVSAFRKWAGHAGFGRLETEIARQRQLAGKYVEALQGVPGISGVRVPVRSRATYPFLTLILDPDRARRLGPLKKSGWGISDLFSAAIPDYAYLKGYVTAGDCPNARSLSRRVFTVPTGLFVTDEDMAMICRLIKK